MKKDVLFVVCICLFISQAVVAGNLGLGVSIKSNDASIYLPIKVHEEFRVEPFIRYFSREGSEKVEEFGNSYKDDYSSLNVGIGLFKIQALSEQISTYYGFRSSYTKEEQSYSSSGTFGGYSSDQETSGYTISPTIGFEYSIIQDLLVGFEAEWEFYDLDGKQERDTGEPEHYIERTDIKNKGQGTNTRVTVRYFF